MMIENIRTISLAEREPGGALNEAFLDLQHAWMERGVTRWFSLVEKESTRPMVVFGGFDESQRLIGTLVMVWAHEALERFDELFNSPQRRNQNEATQIGGGVWHLIGVTRHPEIEGEGIGKALLAHGLKWVRQRSGEPLVRTLSPAFGLSELLERIGGSGPMESQVKKAICQCAWSDGRPLLKVLRYHLSGGARLSRVLLDSRATDALSAQVTLSFQYPLRGFVRDMQVNAYEGWVTRRKSRINLSGAQPEGDSPPIVMVDDCNDRDVMDLPFWESDE
jgi:GNAT superfamily N-acetyltransferase